MSETYYVKTFGGLEITNDNVTVNIVELFGKQLDEFVASVIAS